MIVPVQLTFRHLDPGSDLLEYLTRQIDKLRSERYRLTQCHVRLTGNQHHLQGGPYEMRIEVRVRGRRVEINQTGDDAFSLTRAAFEALRKRFDRRQGRRRTSTWRSLQAASTAAIPNPMLEGAAPPAVEHIS